MIAPFWDDRYLVVTLYGYIHLGGNIRNIYILLLLSLSFSIVLGGYDVGDTISESHQNMEFDICYGDYPTETFKLSDFQNKVIWLHFSATWWWPCYTFIQFGEEAEEYWEDNENVAIVDFLDDVEQPYSCSDWGSVGNPDLPIIINDGDYDFHDQFYDIYPTNVFIDHEMRLKSPENDGQKNDWNTWCPNVEIGEIIASSINPVLYSKSL